MSLTTISSQRGRQLRAAAPCAVAVAWLVGCGQGPPTGIPPEDPAESVQLAFAELDKNGDGSLSPAELGPAPGLAASLGRIDTNGDGVLSREELRSRLIDREGMSDLVAPTVSVVRSGEKVAGAVVRLSPDSWQVTGTQRTGSQKTRPQETELVTLSGTTSANGLCSLKAEGGTMRGIPKGFYTVIIQLPSGAGTIKRGCEIADDVNARALTFDVGR